MFSGPRIISPSLCNTFTKRRVPYTLVLLVALIVSIQQAWTQANYDISGTTAVGRSASAALVIKFQRSGTVNAFVPVTAGIVGGDFALAAGGSCVASQAYVAGAQCTMAITFTPSYPGLRSGAVLAKDSQGVVLGSGFVSGRGTGGLPSFVPGTVQTFAGQGDWIYTGDGGPAANSPIFTPRGMVLDFKGNMYLADTGNNRIRRVDARTGVITTVAGTGFTGYSGDSGPATAADIDAPAGMVIDGAGNLYFADERNNLIRRIDAVSQVITTVVGTPRTLGYAGDNGPATGALLDKPLGVAFDLQGNLLVSDSGNNAVRIVDAVSGTIRTLAGTGTPGYNGDNRPATSALLNAPAATLVLPDGTLLISDTGNNRVRRIDPSGKITTIAGNGAPQFQGDGSSATAASLKAPIGLAVDPAGNLYIADSGNNRIRLIAPGTQQISTVMGTDGESFHGDDGPANLASMYRPYSLFFSQNGILYVSDFFHMRIRGIATDQLKLTYSTIRRGKTSVPQRATLANLGNASLTLSDFVLDMSVVDSTITSCSQTAPLATLQTCQLGIQFAPTVTGQDVTGSLRLPSDVINITPAIRLNGEVLDVNPTSATVVSSKNPSILSDNLTFTATVTSDDTGRTGDVTITSDGAALCTAALRPDGTVSCSTVNLALGSHAIVAHYLGDPQNAAATSISLTQVVKQQPVLRLMSSSNPVTVYSPVTFTVVASAMTGTPSGNITFLDGTSTLGTAVLANGRAALTTASLTPGVHNISAQYGGDVSNAPGQTNVLTQEVQQAGTTTTLTVTDSTPPVGAAVTFTANVSIVSGRTPPGTVQFKDGSAVIGKALLTSSGSAAFSVSTLAPGTHTIVALYEGDVENSTSSSAPLAVTVQHLATNINATPSSNPLSAGATLHLSSTVAMASVATAQGPVTGTVTFREGSTTYDQVALDGLQQAGTDLRNLPVGTHVITLTYGGNNNYLGSYTTLTVVVNQTPSSISLSDASATTLAGGNATWTAAVSSSTGIPTGTVTFLDQSATLGSGTIDAHGVATFSSSSLSVGNHTITAVYGGDANYTSANSAPLTHTVKRATPVLTLSGPASPAVNVTSNVSFSLSLSGAGVKPTGSLSLYDGSSVLATLPVTSSGMGSFNTTTLPLGQHTLTATYGGDNYNDSAASTTIIIDVQRAATLTALVSSANPVTLGAPVTLTANVTAPTQNLAGTVNFYDGQQIIGSAVLGSGPASFTTSQLTFGHHALSAGYAGSDIHSASISVAVDESVRYGARVDVSSNLNPSNSGQNITFTATVQSVGSLVPTGIVTFTNSGVALGTGRLDGSGRATLQTSSLDVGSHTIEVSFAGDANFSSGTSSLAQSVSSSNSSTMLSVSTSPATYGTPLVLTAAVSTNGGVASGKVLFLENDNTVGSASLNAGMAVFTTASLAPGRHNIVASYQTDGRTDASTSAPVSFLVQQKTALSLNFDSNPVLTLNPVAMTAVLTNSDAAPATGSVLFFDGTSSLGSALLVKGAATIVVPLLSAGTHLISARYAGDDANFPATAPAVSELVKLRATTTSLTSSATNAADSQQVTLISIVQSPTLSATGVPTGSVTFSQGQQVIGTVVITSAGLATLNQHLEAGAKEAVIATYNGDANYSTSTSATVNVQSGPPVNFILTTDSTQVQLTSGQHQMLTVTLTSIKGFTDTIRLGCVGLPYAATCTFAKTSVALAADGIQTMQLMVDTGDPLGQGGATSASTRRQDTFAAPLLCLLPGGLLLILCRKRSLVPVLAMLLLSALVLGNSGCSGLRMSSTPSGTYTFQVTGVGTGSGAKQTQTVVLVVGK